MLCQKLVKGYTFWIIITLNSSGEFARKLIWLLVITKLPSILGQKKMSKLSRKWETFTDLIIPFRGILLRKSEIEHISGHVNRTG